MKKFTIVALVGLFALSAKAQESVVLKPASTTATPMAAVTEVKDINKYVEFKNAEYDFGKIPFGKPAEYEVEVKNISHDTLTLTRVQAGCGCTTPKYEANKKIAPGESAKITLGFNGGTQGAFTKVVTVFINDNMQKVLTFKGETYSTPDTSAPANAPVQKMKEAGNN